MHQNLFVAAGLSAAMRETSLCAGPYVPAGKLQDVDSWNLRRAVGWRDLVKNGLQRARIVSARDRGRRVSAHLDFCRATAGQTLAELAMARDGRGTPAV
jgi:hypothetical protein